MYIHGRDKIFRPCLVIDASVLQSFKDKYPGEYNLEVVLIVNIFLMEYCLNNMMLPGQVEHWITITNLSKLSISSLPKKEMQGIISVLSSNYLFTLGKSVHVNCTSMQLFFWKVIEVFVDRETT